MSVCSSIYLYTFLQFAFLCLEVRDVCSPKSAKWRHKNGCWLEILILMMKDSNLNLCWWQLHLLFVCQVSWWMDHNKSLSSVGVDGKWLVTFLLVLLTIRNVQKRHWLIVLYNYCRLYHFSNPRLFGVEIQKFKLKVLFRIVQRFDTHQILSC